MKTYTKSTTGIGLLNEAVILFRAANAPLDGQVTFLVDQMQKAELRIKNVTAMSLENLDVLVVGPGQKMREMIYLSTKNRVVGIDLDVIASAFSLRTYIEMFRVNGPMRTLKTLVRKQMGIDTRFEQALKHRLKIDSIPPPNLIQMDAAKMTFPDNSFDFVYSFSVFEHIPDPGAVLDEIVRVLRPGGVCYISLHLYTSLTGCHDLNVFANEGTPPYWPHLRPQLKSNVHPNAFLNELRVPEWKESFDRRLPGVIFELDGLSSPIIDTVQNELAQIRAQGELTDYTDEELLNVNFIAVWQKPKG